MTDFWHVGELVEGKFERVQDTISSVGIIFGYERDDIAELDLGFGREPITATHALFFALLFRALLFRRSLICATAVGPSTSCPASA